MHHMIVTIEAEKPTQSMDEDLQERLQHRRQGKIIYSNRKISHNALNVISSLTNLMFTHTTSMNSSLVNQTTFLGMVLIDYRI